MLRNKTLASYAIDITKILEKNNISTIFVSAILTAYLLDVYHKIEDAPLDWYNLYLVLDIIGACSHYEAFIKILNRDTSEIIDFIKNYSEDDLIIYIKFK